ISDLFMLLITSKRWINSWALGFSVFEGLLVLEVGVTIIVALAGKAKAMNITKAAIRKKFFARIFYFLKSYLFFAITKMFLIADKGAQLSVYSCYTLL